MKERFGESRGRKGVKRTISRVRKIKEEMTDGYSNRIKGTKI